MAYEYRKSRSLNKKERSRLRLSVVLDRQLRAMNEENSTGLGLIWKRYMSDVFRKIRLQCPGRGRHATLLDQLLLVFSRPSGNIKDTTIHWLLCYATPSVLKKLIAALAHEDPQNKYLELMKKADPSLLLTKNHMVPDFQKFQPYSGKPKKALICFSGNAHQLMVPLQLFHVLAVEMFDLIIYLRDDRKQHFMYGIPGMGNNLTELGSTLQKMIPEDCHTAILATSAGGWGAFKIGAALQVQRMVLFSPPFSFKGIMAMDDHVKISPNTVRLYFAQNSTMDKGFFESWKNTYLNGSVRWLGFDGHDTLKHLIFSSQFDSLGHWLAGTNSSYDETA